VYAIVRRSDGFFGYYEDLFVHDDEDDFDYWQTAGGDPASIFGTVDEAERQIRGRYRLS
jgi:hypothetical protein